VGYGLGDPNVRRTADYYRTVVFTSAASESEKQAAEAASENTVLPPQVVPLFAQGGKGPRADRFADAIAAVGMDGIERTGKGAASGAVTPGEEPRLVTAAVAGASLFLTSARPETVSFPADAAGKSAPQTDAAPPATSAPGGPAPSWKGLLLNASVGPDQPTTLFGGLTEDEFRVRELRCMATAIYFEARDEPIKGQIAVGQVIMNRIRSPYYPKTICGVVYEGERLRRGCQFSFTCTGKKNRVNELKEWAMSVKLAKQIISGEVWLPEVGYATHYHATYVKPPWRHELDRIVQIGAHIFYKVKSDKVQYALLREGL
jgi:spore germination cell wall hydrolase CwlJ-like protein